MRIACLLALAAIGVAGIQAQSARESVVVILDSDGPVANAEASARLRALALARVERYGRPVYFHLTADAITPVPDSAGECFRNATFTFRPPIYAGVSLSFGEASEILRKNEAARDTVIVRSVPRGRQAIVAERFTAPRPRSSETPSLRAPESCGASSRRRHRAGRRP